jgi:stearoyl-CoA desaturase (Delta-9 desaturase)
VADGPAADSRYQPVLSDPLPGDRQGPWQRLVLALFVGIPTLAVLGAAAVAWGWGLGWRDVAIAVALYVFTGYGITAGFHRHFSPTVR